MPAEIFSQTLINKETREIAFRLYPVDIDNNYAGLQRLNYYSVIWFYRGKGKLRVDMNEYEFDGDIMYFFSPYQPFQFMHEQDAMGMAIHFHPDFFCIEKHRNEVACNGVLFNNIYQPPCIMVRGKDVSFFSEIMNKLSEEMNSNEIARNDMLVSYLKIFLINASRIKIDQTPQAQGGISAKGEPYVLQQLKTLIEKNFREKHSPSEFANLLFITPKALGRLTRMHFNKTPSELIHERIIIEAKRELYLTNKTVKEIAYELGFDDEFYFSRFFKNNTDVSPQMYREKVGFNRGGNLSIN
jgi:AraC-like DNA-binding protein